MKNSISFLFPVTAAVAVLSCIASCSPIAYTMRLDLKTPSKSGIELGGKSVAVVYNDNGNSFDSLFIASVSEGFAEQLEKEYFSDRRAIGIFKTDGEADYVSKDSLVNILVDTGSDVVFYYDSPVFDEMTLTSPSKLANPSSSDSSYVSALTIPFSVKLYVYDSMDKADEMREFSGSSTWSFCGSDDIHFAGGADAGGASRTGRRIRFAARRTAGNAGAGGRHGDHCGDRQDDSGGGKPTPCPQ